MLTGRLLSAVLLVSMAAVAPVATAIADHSQPSVSAPTSGETGIEYEACQVHWDGDTCNFQCDPVSDFGDVHASGQADASCSLSTVESKHFSTPIDPQLFGECEGTGPSGGECWGETEIGQI